MSKIRKQENEQITVRLSEEEFEFVRTHGGRKMVRRLITHEYGRQVRPDTVMPDYPWGSLSSGGRINVRLIPQLIAFSQKMGGAPYVRALVHDYMLYTKHKEELANPSPGVERKGEAQGG